MHNHQCIKCKKQYRDAEPEPYYCESCQAENKKVASEVDKRMAARPKSGGKSMLQEYDEAPKYKGFMIWKP